MSILIIVNKFKHLKYSYNEMKLLTLFKSKIMMNSRQYRNSTINKLICRVQSECRTPSVFISKDQSFNELYESIYESNQELSGSKFLLDICDYRTTEEEKNIRNKLERIGSIYIPIANVYDKQIVNLAQSFKDY